MPKILALICTAVLFTFSAEGTRALISEETCSVSLVNPGNERLVEKNRYTDWRTLIDYLMALHPDFRQELSQLGPNDIILDGGAGRAIMLIEYLYNLTVDYVHPVILPKPEKRARAIAVGFTRPAYRRLEDAEERKRADKDPRFQYITGDLGTMLDRHPELEGQVKVVVDMRGILQYSHLQKTLEIYLRLLKRGGKIYFENPNAVIFKNGKPVSIVQYLSAITGTELTWVRGSYRGRFLQEQHAYDLILKKTSKKFIVPGLQHRDSDTVHDVTGVEAKYDWL